jgi:hypothetical protein
MRPPPSYHSFNGTQRLAFDQTAGHLDDSEARDGPVHVPAPAEGLGDFAAITNASIALLSAAHHARTLSATATARPSQASSSVPTSPEPLHQTDTASIRRRYMALEKGPGTKPELLLSGGPDKLFKGAVLLDFEEDSPQFRTKLQALDENVEGMRRHLQRLVSIMGKYIETGQAFSAAGRLFASELMHLEGESWFTRLGDLAPALVRFGETIDEIQNLRDAALESLESTFISPMNEFVKRELKEVREQKDEISRAYDDYLDKLQKYLQLKRGEGALSGDLIHRPHLEGIATELCLPYLVVPAGSEPALVQQRTHELIAVRRRYELARFDLVSECVQHAGPRCRRYVLTGSLTFPGR